MPTPPPKHSSSSPRIFGPAYSSKLNVVELPNDTVPSAWAPEIAAIAVAGLQPEGELPPAGQHHRASVVGNDGQPGDPERLVDQRRLRALLGGAVRGARRRAGGLRGSHQGHGGRSAGLQSRSAVAGGQAGHVLAGVSVAGDRQGRQRAEHAALGHRRPGVRQDHARLSGAILGQAGNGGRFAQSRRDRTRASSSRGSLPSGSIPPARRSSRPSTPSTARRRASAWSAKSSRTSTCSACRWS